MTKYTDVIFVERVSVLDNAPTIEAKFRELLLPYHKRQDSEGVTYFHCQEKAAAQVSSALQSEGVPHEWGAERWSA